MEQHRLIKWLKFLVIFAAGCGMVMDLGVLPGVGSWMVDLAPEFGGYFWPWLIFLWILSVPCYMALWMAWKIFTDIEKDKAFTMENAKRMGNVSFLAAADAVLLVVGNVVSGGVAGFISYCIGGNCHCHRGGHAVPSHPESGEAAG